MKEIEERLQMFFDEFKNLLKNYKYTSFLLLIISIFGLPFLLTQCEFGYSLGLEDSNEIGDALGGTLGPYLSFIGSCLLAYTIYLQIEQRKDDKQKEYEKVIFEETTQILKNAENKIFELNLTRPQDPFASQMYFNGYFSFVVMGSQTNELLKVKLFINETSNAISLFNESSIKDNGYQTIIIRKIDQVFFLMGDSGLMCYNDKNRFDLNSPIFFKFESIVKYEEVKKFFSEVKKIKENFQKEFDQEFQKDEINQLTETLIWLESFEEDLRNYFKFKSELELYQGFNFGKGLYFKDEIKKNEYESIKHQKEAIEKKYHISFDDDVFD